MFTPLNRVNMSLKANSKKFPNKFQLFALEAIRPATDFVDRVIPFPADEFNSFGIRYGSVALGYLIGLCGRQINGGRGVRWDGDLPVKGFIFFLPMAANHAIG